MSTTTHDETNKGNGSELPKHLNWETIPVEQTAEGIERQMFMATA